MMEIVWFSKITTFSTAYKPGVEYVIFGKPNYFRNAYSMVHPEVEQFDPAKPPTGFRGVYSLTETMRKRGYTTRLLQTLVGNLLSMPGLASVDDTLPADVVRRYSLYACSGGFQADSLSGKRRLLQKAIERFKFEELFYVEAHILRYTMERSAKIPGYLFGRIGEKFNGFYFNVLPFELTGAQKRVLKEIRADMKTGRQMNRLLQGDVGSGKTMVAFMSMLMAVDNGCQSALILLPRFLPPSISRH